MNVRELEKMLEYNIKKGASKKRIAEIREEINIAKKNVSSSGWASVYAEDKHRGEGGGSSEKTNTAALKTLMKDNRIRETKYTQTQRAMVNEVTDEWCKENNRDRKTFEPIEENL